MFYNTTELDSAHCLKYRLLNVRLSGCWLYLCLVVTGSHHVAQPTVAYLRQCTLSKAILLYKSISAENRLQLHGPTISTKLPCDIHRFSGLIPDIHVKKTTFLYWQVPINLVFHEMYECVPLCFMITCIPWNNIKYDSKTSDYSQTTSNIHTAT